MAYKFNSGHGAIICDDCRVIMMEGLGHDDYLRIREELGLPEDLDDWCLDYLNKECKDD